MQVELRGGPRDGEVIELPDGSIGYKFPARRFPVHLFEPELAYQTDIIAVAADIEKDLLTGKFYINVPKETYLA